MPINIDLRKIKTVSLSARPSKVKRSDFGKTLEKPVKFSNFFDSIPEILAGKNFKNLIKSILVAKRKKKPVILSFGAHVIKCGLAPVVVDLLKKRYVTAIASNGASTIHDFELACSGQTSEDVAERLKDGSFGMTRETGEFINSAVKEAAGTGSGAGEAIGRKIYSSKLPYKKYSIFANAYKLGVSATVHAAIGTDIVYQHPQCDGAAWGSASYTDFLKFADTVSRLGHGGVMINFGSAVIMPEVFLKSLTVARNLGFDVFDFTTANFDMIRQYRPFQNIVSRPTLGTGKGYDFSGHHEIMLPLLYAALIDGDK